jgi:hypothetical protein
MVAGRTLLWRILHSVKSIQRHGKHINKIRHSSVRPATIHITSGPEPSPSCSVLVLVMRSRSALGIWGSISGLGSGPEVM